MINGDLNCFLETITIGCGVYLGYKGKKYFAQGWFTRENRKYFLCITDESEDTLNTPDSDIHVWSIESDSPEYNVAQFLDAKIFFGKSFREVEGQIEWLDE